MKFGASLNCLVDCDEVIVVGGGNSLVVCSESDSLEGLEQRLSREYSLQPTRDHLFVGYSIFGREDLKIVSVLIDSRVDPGALPPADQEAAHAFANNREVEFPTAHGVIFSYD